MFWVEIPFFFSTFPAFLIICKYFAFSFEVFLVSISSVLYYSSCQEHCHSFYSPLRLCSPWRAQATAPFPEASGDVSFLLIYVSFLPLRQIRSAFRASTMAYVFSVISYNVLHNFVSRVATVRIYQLICQYIVPRLLTYVRNASLC